MNQFMHYPMGLGDQNPFDLRYPIYSNHPTNLKQAFTIKPEPYTGKDDWDEYISHFEDFAELGKWTKNDKVLALAASLKGQARTSYISLPSSEKRSYDVLVTKLEQRFGSSRQQGRWASRLQLRTRKEGESIATLGDDLRQMTQKAYPTLDANAQEVLALQQFYKAIPLEMRCRCMDRDCKTLTEAVDVVERYEAILTENTDKNKRSSVRGFLPLKKNQKEHTPNRTIKIKVKTTPLRRLLKM